MSYFHYAVILPNGDILQTGIATDEESLQYMGFDGGIAKKCPEWVNDRDHYYKDGNYRKYPPRPSKDHIWDGNEWVDFRTDEEERQEKRLKIVQIRDALLAESDWTQVLDSPLSPEKRAEWAKYRQELRDITLQIDEANIMWPTKPE